MGSVWLSFLTNIADTAVEQLVPMHLIVGYRNGNWDLINLSKEKHTSFLATRLTQVIRGKSFQFLQ